MEVQRVTTMMTMIKSWRWNDLVVPAAQAYPIMAIIFLQTAAFAAIFVAINQRYLVDELGLGVAFPGYVLTAVGIAKLTLLSPAGWLVDRLGRCWILTLSLSLKMVAVALLMILHWPIAILGLATLFGVAMAIASTASSAIVADTQGYSTRGKANAFINITYFMGIGIGAMVGAFLAGFALYTLAFLLVVAGLGLAVILSLTSVRRGSHYRPTNNRQSRRQLTACLGSLWNPTAVAVAAVALLVGVSANMLSPVMRPYVTQVLGLELHQVFPYMALPGLVALLMMVPAGHLADHWGRLPPLFLGLIMAAAGLMALAQASSVWVVMALALPAMMGQVFTTPSWSALVMDLSRAENRGVVWGLMATVQGTGGAVGPTIGGQWTEMYGPLSSFRLAGGLLLMAAVIAYAAWLIARRQALLPASAPEPVRLRD